MGVEPHSLPFPAQGAFVELRAHPNCDSSWTPLIREPLLRVLEDSEMGKQIGTEKDDAGWGRVLFR